MKKFKKFSYTIITITSGRVQYSCSFIFLHK